MPTAGPSRGFWSRLSPDVQKQLAAVATRVTYATGQLVQTRGDVAVDVSIIRSGGVRFGTTGRNGSFLFVSQLGVGDAYGDLGVFGADARVLDGYALSKTVIDRIPADRFLELIRNSPDLSIGLLRIMARRLVLAIDHIDDLMRQPLVVRVARYVMFLQEAAKDPHRIEIGQSDLAEATAASRVSVSKCLKELARKGLVETGYGYLTIPDPARLRGWIAEMEEVERIRG